MNTLQRSKYIVRAYNRILAQRTEGWEEAEACDSQYDAGEWSGPAWGDNWQRVESEVAEYVAERFGVPVGAVEFAVIEADYEREACFYRALDLRSGPTAMGMQQ